MTFKFDACSNLTKGEKAIAKAIWLSNMAEPSSIDGRFKVPKAVEEIIGKIMFWPHEADKVISTNPWEYGKVVTIGNPYIFIYKER